MLRRLLPVLWDPGLWERLFAKLFEGDPFESACRPAPIKLSSFRKLNREEPSHRGSILAIALPRLVVACYQSVSSRLLYLGTLAVDSTLMSLRSESGG